ncbi:glycosyltransferase family 4 protein [Candidatus Woesebacteria bacterium]|nr:glycosyltransferase family 4 protein [Candidatus Woesebacteria bacterium]
MQRKKNNKILFILESFYPNIGGVEYLFKQLVDSLVRLNWDVTVLTAKSYENTKINKIENLKIFRIPVRSRYLFTFLAFCYSIFLIPGKDIVHTSTYNAALPAFFISKLFNKKVIVTFHEYWGKLWFEYPFISKFKQKLFFNFEKFIARLKFDKFIAVSKYTKDSLITSGVDPKRIETIYNGIDYSGFQAVVKNRDNKNFTFLYSGRAGISKGLDVLIEAVKYSKKLDYKLIIHSADSRQFGVLNEIEKLVVDYDLTDKVVFQKNKLSQKDTLQLMKNADCIIVPSYSEGFCFSAVEACALGVPIIHSGRGALSEVVSGKYLVFENMSTKSLADKMRLAIEGKFDSKPLKKFEIDESVRGYIDVYERL